MDIQTIYTKKSNAYNARERFQLEYKSMTSLRERITPQRYDKLFPKYNRLYTKDGYSCLDMEYIKGETLASILERNATAPTSCVLLLEPYKVKNLFKQLTEAHRYLVDEGMLYLDINPHNIIITDSERFTIKIVDFTDCYYLNKCDKNNHKIISGKLNPNASLPLQLRDSAMILFSMLFSSANMKQIKNCYGGRYRVLFDETDVHHISTTIDTRDLLVLWNEWCDQLRITLLNSY